MRRLVVGVGLLVALGPLQAAEKQDGVTICCPVPPKDEPGSRHLTIILSETPTQIEKLKSDVARLEKLVGQLQEQIETLKAYPDWKVGKHAKPQSAYCIEPPDVLMLEWSHEDACSAEYQQPLRKMVKTESLVRPDGTIGLGKYGAVLVAGLTIPQAKEAVERHLSQFVQHPAATLDVAFYNSKVYYVIASGPGETEQVYRFPITGNECVLDAIAQVQGLSEIAARKRIWVTRPTPASSEDCRVLPVDWKAITRQRGMTRTNYQLMPGDRLYVVEPRPVSSGVQRSKSPDPSAQIQEQLNHSEDLREIQKEWRRIWINDQPAHLTPQPSEGPLQ